MTVKKSFYKYFALLSAGAVLAGTLYTGRTEAAVPKKENFGTTCQMLRDSAARTIAADHCTLNISFGAVNNNDRVIFTADNIIAAHDKGSKTFLEGTIQKTTIIAGMKTDVTIPYYIMRDGRSISCLIKKNGEWKALPLPVLTGLIEKGYGLQELFAPNKTAECLNETEKGRTTVFYTNLIPPTELLFSLLSAADLLPAPKFSAESGQKVRPVEVFVRQDYTQGIISNINTDVTWFIRDYLKQNPKAMTADEEQAAIRKVLEKSEMNFHIAVNDTNKKIEFHDIPADLNAAFGLEIPRELLSESQLKEKQKAEASSADDEESLSEEE